MIATSPDTLLCEATKLAKAHRKDEPGLKFFLFSEQGDEEIRLLEVSEYVFTLGKILPYTFSDSQTGVHHPLTLILVSPEDWEAIKKGKINLPNNAWQLSSYKQFVKNGKIWEWRPFLKTV